MICFIKQRVEKVHLTTHETIGLLLQYLSFYGLSIANSWGGSSLLNAGRSWNRNCLCIFFMLSDNFTFRAAAVVKSAGSFAGRMLFHFLLVH